MYWLDRPEEAELLARKALALSVQSGEVSEYCYSTLIDILIGRKKFAQARRLIGRALRDCPGESMEDMGAQRLKEIESSREAIH